MGPKKSPHREGVAFNEDHEFEYQRYSTEQVAITLDTANTLVTYPDNTFQKCRQF